MSFSSFHESIYSQGMLGMLAGIFAVCATCWIMLRQADSVLGVLGVNGANALTKIMAFLLLAIGVQLAMNGGEHWLQQTFAAAKP